MKGENYLYFCDTTDEPNATDEAVLVPASAVLGVSINLFGINQGQLYLSHQGFVGDNNSKGAVNISITPGKDKEAMDDIAAAMSSNPGTGFTVICDVQNNVFCSDHITGCTVDSAV